MSGRRADQEQQRLASPLAGIYMEVERRGDNRCARDDRRRVAAAEPLRSRRRRAQSGDVDPRHTAATSLIPHLLPQCMRTAPKQKGPEKHERLPGLEPLTGRT